MTPIFWTVQADVYCDVTGCKAKLTVCGETLRESITWIRQAGWSYNKDPDNDRIIVKCPDHAQSKPVSESLWP